MNTASSTAGVAVLCFAGAPAPAPLAAARPLSTVSITDPAALDATLDDLLDGVRRLVVVGGDADLAAVLTRLLRRERLDVEVARAATRRAARRALTGTAREVPLIRDETGTVLVGAARWHGVDGRLHGEAVVDDTVLFDGEVTAVRIEPLAELPGVRAAVETRFRRRRWVEGRAAQLGTTGARVIRDGVPVPKPVRRSTFYRHTQGWLRVR